VGGVLENDLFAAEGEAVDDDGAFEVDGGVTGAESDDVIHERIGRILEAEVGGVFVADLRLIFRDGFERRDDEEGEGGVVENLEPGERGFFGVGEEGVLFYVFKTEETPRHVNDVFGLHVHLFDLG